MRIAINTRLLLKDKLEGIGWFSYETLRRITTLHSEHEFMFIFDRAYDPNFIFSDNIVPLVVFPPTRHPLLWYLWFEHRLPKILKTYNANIFVSPDGYLSLQSNIPSLSVIHDINFVHHPEYLPFFTSKFYNYYFPRYAQKATRVATVSHYSRNDISQQFGIPESKIDILYNGSNVIYKPLDELERQTAKQKYAQGADYFVFVGALNPRKNIVGLLQAFELFKLNYPNNYKLVIVGDAMFKTHEILRQLKHMRNKQDVIFTGRLNPEELHQVLGSAHALTFVPYFEGFGIPILEAMNCEIPIICSNVTSMPEVAGDAALYVNPYNVEEIANCMYRIIAEPELRSSLIAQGRIRKNMFSWDKTAELFWKSIEKCL